MQQVNYSDIERSWSFLSKYVELFDKSTYTQLHDFLKIRPKKKVGLDFCNNVSIIPKLQKVFEELNKNNQISISKKNIVSSKKNIVEDLKATIKNLKDIKIEEPGKNNHAKKRPRYDEETNNKISQEKEFIKKFLKYITDVLRYEKHKKVEKVTLEDSDIDTRVLSNGNLKDKGYVYMEIMESIKKGILNPKVEHIKQGRIGDCYLLSSLMGVIKSNKDKITKCFVNRETIDKDAYAKIRFYKVKLSSETNSKYEEETVARPNGKFIVKIDKTLLQYLDETSKTWQNVHNKKQETEALWVNLIEKAFMVYKNDKGCVTASSSNAKLANDWYKTALNYSRAGAIGVSAESIRGGKAFIAIAAITGKTTRRNMSINELLDKIELKKFPVAGGYSSEANAIYDFFKNKINNNKTVVVSTKSDTFEQKIGKNLWQTKAGKEKNYPGLMGRHAYAVVEKVEEDKNGVDCNGKKATIKYVCLQNPHAYEGFLKYTGRKKYRDGQINGGKLRMELNDFLKYFKCYDVMD